MITVIIWKRSCINLYLSSNVTVHSIKVTTFCVQDVNNISSTPQQGENNQIYKGQGRISRVYPPPFQITSSDII